MSAITSSKVHNFTPDSSEKTQEEILVGNTVQPGPLSFHGFRVSVTCWSYGIAHSTFLASEAACEMR